MIKVRPKVKRIVGLTGTPSSNGLMDLFAEFKLCLLYTSFIGYGFTAEFVFIYLWFDVGEASAGGKLDKEHSTLIFEYNPFYSCLGVFLDSCFYCPVNIPPEADNIRI